MSRAHPPATHSVLRLDTAQTVQKHSVEGAATRLPPTQQKQTNAQTMYQYGNFNKIFGYAKNKK